jgi:short-subunit dehydrogenase
MTDAYIASLAALDKAQGTIINLSSAMAIFDFPGSSAYTVSKLAVAKLTQAVHVGMAPLFLPSL